jgi:hypothetical protein
MKYLKIFILCFFAVSIFGQNLDLVTIRGKVTDSNGAVVPGATVKVTLTQTGAERRTVTNEEGIYQIADLQPGEYSIKVEMQGFATQIKTGITTLSGQNVQMDFSLSPATVTAEQTIRISDEDPLAIDTTRTVVGGTLTERELEELPNNTRNPLDLILVLGGITEEPLSTRDLASDRGLRGISSPRTTPEEAGIFGLSGGAAYSNNITIDGLDNNDDRAATL